MKKKGDGNETLSLFFKRDGVLLNMVMYGSKDQTLGLFSKKHQEPDFYMKKMEPYSTWRLQAEDTNSELNKGDGRKMVQYVASKRNWDDALDFESYVRSHTALGVYMLQGEVPETVMLDGNSDTSQSC